jgi:hypothetical protein
MSPKPLRAYLLLAASALAACAMTGTAGQGHGSASPAGPHSENYASIECGLYGPCRTEIDCKDSRLLPHCWCEAQAAGYGDARCECIPNPGPPTQPTDAQTTCAAEASSIACGLMQPIGDFGCSIRCPSNARAECVKAHCEGANHLSSRCACI